MESQQESPGAEGVTQLDFQQAMNDFQNMFPSMEPAVIEAVLRANHGAVDATIDQLLSMTSDNEAERSSKCSEKVDSPPGYFQAMQSLSDESLIRPNSVRNSNILAPLFTNKEILGIPLCSSRGWKPLLLPLPPDFLRLERIRSPRHGQGFAFFKKIHNHILKIQNLLESSQINYHKRCIRDQWVRRQEKFNQTMHFYDTVLDLADNIEESEEELLPSGRWMLKQDEQNRQDFDSGSQSLQQVLDDERLAIILQNAEFVEALRNDHDFMESLVEQETSKDDLPGGTVKPLDEEAAFRERLRRMGKVPRRKLTQFARNFFRGKKLTFNPGSNLFKEQSILCDQDEECNTYANQDEKNQWPTQGSHK